MRFLITVIFMCFSLCAQAQIEVFNLDGWTPEYADKVHNLRAGTEAKEALNQKFKRLNILDEESAKKLVTQDIQDAISNEVRSLSLAAKYKLRYLPAVVINKKYVMYGKPTKGEVLKVEGIQ